jgi:hypothetical protein
MPKKQGYFLVNVQELQRPEVIHSVKVRWYSSIKDLKDQLHVITNEPPSTQHIFHPSNPTEFRNSSTLQSIGIEHDGFTLKVAFDDYVRASFYLEPLKKDLLDAAASNMLEEVRQGLIRDKQPKVTDKLDGSGGVYFLRSLKGFYAAVFKPHDEEQGMPNNPKGYDGDGHTGLRDHFRPGQGCLREVAACIMDHGNFCGVPPTALIHCQHPLFSYPTAAGKRKLFPKLGSLQQFIRASECFDDLGPGQFSDFEIQKIALLDLRLLNCDRNAANMLVRYKDHVSTGSSSSDGNGSRDKDYSPVQTNGDGDWYADKSPSSEPSDLYELVPIDHGYCMPSKLRIDEFDLTWFTLPQVKREVHPAIKEYVASLDFESMLYSVLEQISLPGNSIFLLALAHLLVVQGIASGLTLYEIATLVARVDDEHASKLEQAIEEAEDNAFRAIEMKSKRIPSNPTLHTNHHHPNLKSATSPMLRKGTVNSNSSDDDAGSNNSPLKDMDLVTTPLPSPSAVKKEFYMSSSTSLNNVLHAAKMNTEHRHEESESNHLTNDSVESKTTGKTLSIGSGDGVWDIKSIAACASPLASVMKTHLPAASIVDKKAAQPPDLSASKLSSSDNGSLAVEASFSVNISSQNPHRPSPLELGSDFLSDIILAACDDDCEVAINSPAKLSPCVYSPMRSAQTPSDLRKSPGPLIRKDVDFQPPTEGYLPSIKEDRRMRGNSQGSTCSSTDNNDCVAQAVVDSMTTSESVTPLLAENISVPEQSSSLADPPPDRLGAALSKQPRANETLPPSLPRFSPAMLTSPKFVCALSNMHGSQIIEDNVAGGYDMLSNLPHQGTELSRMRSVDSSSHRSQLPAATYYKDDSNTLHSDSLVSFGVNDTKTDSTFEAAGTGFDIDIEGELDTASTMDHASPEIESVVKISLQEANRLAALKDESSSANSSSTKFSGMVSPLARILAVPSDPNLSTSLLEACMTAGENNVNPIQQPRLRKLPSGIGAGSGAGDTATVPPAQGVSSAGKNDNFVTPTDTPVRKRKHDSFTSEYDVAADDMESSRRPNLTPSPARQRQLSDGEVPSGSRSAAPAPAAADKAPAWLQGKGQGSTGSAHKQHATDDLDLCEAPGMNRVASFSGFESAPIYDFHSEGRFGSLRQEKRKIIMKTPEFNKFRLHFAHEAVLSIINRLLRQKEAEKAETKVK